MRIVPFDDDAAKITAREQEIELKNLIDTLDFGSRDILEELEGSNVDRRLAKLFRDYQSVLSIAPLNPRLLYRLGDIVATLIRGAEVREEFSDLSLIKIEGFVEDHKNLMRVYYAQAIARAHEVDRLNVRAGSTLDQVAVALEAAAKTILNIHTYGNLPRAEDSIPALLEDLRQDIVNYARSERKIAGDGGSGAEPSLGWKAAKTGAVSVLRFLLRAGERALHSSAALETVWPGSVRKIYESLKEIFPGMPDLPR